MKNILISTMLCLGLAACGRNSIEHPINVVPVTTVAPPVVPAPTTQSIKGNGWEMTVPVTWEKVETDVDESELICYGNKKDQILGCMEKHQFSDSLDKFVQAGAESVAETGGHIVAAQAVTINNVKFFLLTIKKDEASLWSWLTLENGSAYALSCGGASAESQGICNNIVNSLKFTK